MTASDSRKGRREGARKLSASAIVGLPQMEGTVDEGIN